MGDTKEKTEGDLARVQNALAAVKEARAVLEEARCKVEAEAVAARLEVERMSLLL